MAVPAARAVARSSSTARAAGYVPDGLSVKEWEAMKKKKADAATKKKQYYKNKTYEVGGTPVTLGYCRLQTLIRPKSIHHLVRERVS